MVKIWRHWSGNKRYLIWKLWVWGFQKCMTLGYPVSGARQRRARSFAGRWPGYHHKTKVFRPKTITIECRSSTVAWFLCHTWYLRSAENQLIQLIQLKVAKLKVFYIPSVAHQSRCKPQPKANGDRPIKKSADSADGQLAWFGFCLVFWTLDTQVSYIFGILRPIAFIWDIVCCRTGTFIFWPLNGTRLLT